MIINKPKMKNEFRLFLNIFLILCLIFSIQTQTFEKINYGAYKEVPR